MLPVYFEDNQFQTALDAIRAAANATCPVTGLPDQGALIIALGQHFNVWSGALLDDPHAEPGFRTAPLPQPAFTAEPGFRALVEAMGAIG